MQHKIRAILLDMIYYDMIAKVQIAMWPCDYFDFVKQSIVFESFRNDLFSSCCYMFSEKYK